MNPKTSEEIEELLIALHIRYKKREANFVFKSKSLAKETHFSPQKIGYLVVQAIKRGHPLRYYTHPKRGRNKWQTTFKE